jgi:hypothetical protein
MKNQFVIFVSGIFRVWYPCVVLTPYNFHMTPRSALIIKTMPPSGCVACIQERGRQTRELFSVLSRVLWHTHFYLKIFSSIYLGHANFLQPQGILYIIALVSQY